MKRTKNLQDLADSLAKMCFGRTLSEAHGKSICIQYQKPVEKFPDDETRRGYEISGLCLECQKTI